MKRPIQIALPDPPYLFAAVNSDYEERGIQDVYRLMVLLDFPTEKDLENLRAQVEEDRSVIDDFTVIESPPELFEQYAQETYHVYRRLLN